MGTSKSEFAKREGKDGLLIHAPIPAAFCLFFVPLSFFLSVLSLLLVSYYSPVVGCSLFLVFPFPGYLSLGAYYSLTMGFPPLKCFPPLGLPLLVFFSLPLFFPPPFSPPSRDAFHPWLPLSFIVS